MAGDKILNNDFFEVKGVIAHGNLRIGTHAVHEGYTGLWNTVASTTTTGQYLIISSGTDTYVNGDSVYIRAGNNSNSNELRVQTTGVTIGGNTVFHAGNSVAFTSDDNTKLDNIEAGADVTDATNVAAAGALMTTGGTMSGALNASGGLYFVGETNYMGFVPYPKGAQYRNDSSSVTGAIKIKLPTAIGASPDDMVSFHVDIYDYTTNEMVTVYVGGYTYRTTSTSTYWYNTTAIVTAHKTDKNFTVRFGNDGTNYYVAIGETTSTWSHPSIVVRDFQGSYRTDITHYKDGWDIDIVSDDLAGVDETRTNNFPAADYDKLINKPSNATTSVAGFMSSTDKTKLDGIESGADVTDATNVATAGAVMTSGGTMTGVLRLQGQVDNFDGQDRSSYWSYDDKVALALEPAADDGAVAMIFPSIGNKPSDFAYIVYDEDYGEAGVTSTENSVLIIGSENDGTGSSDHVRVKSRLVVEADMSSSDPTNAFEVKSGNVTANLFTVARDGNVYIGSSNLTATKVGNWDTAYNWGNHASAGYLTTVSFSDLTGKPTTLSGYGIIDGASLGLDQVFTGDAEFEGDLLRTNQRISNNQEYPLGHYTPGETVFELNPTWSDRELREYFNSPNVSWDEVANAPGGYAVYIDGNVNVGGAYGSGFPYIPIDQDGIYYMEVWIKNAGTSQGHYMGSIDYEADFTAPASGSGNPGSYGYWVMSNYTGAAEWTKRSGYITGHHNSNTGAFETDATYWTPQALFNYSAGSGTRACWISGWKVIRVDHVGDRTFQDDVKVKGTLKLDSLGANTTSTTALVMNGSEVEKRTLGSNAFNSTSFLTSVDWTDIGAGTRTNYDLGFRPPTSGYAGFNFLGTDGQNAGYFLIRGTSDNGVYTAEGITLVADQGWLTLAQRTASNKGIKFMTGTTATTRMTIAGDGDVNIDNSLTVGADLGVNGFIKDGLYKHAGNTNWRTKKYVRSVGITGGDIADSWVQLSRVTIGATYEKVTIKFTINGYDDVSSGVEAIDVRYENGASAQENHQMAWYSTDDHANLFKNVRSIRSSSSGLSNTYDLYVQMAGDWRDNFTVVAESWTTHAGDSPITYITAAGSANEPSAGSNDIERTERRWYTENSFMYLGANRVYTTGDFSTSDFAAASHTHDDRYYTESEIDTTLAGYSTTSHNHDGTYAAASHDHDDRYHKLDFDSVTGAHQTDSKSGTWTGGSGTSWGSYKPGDDSTAGYYYNDGTGYAQYNIPSGYTTAYIGQLKWDSGGYFDVYAVDSNSNLILRGRYMSLQSIENSNHSGNHDYQQIIKISGLDGMSALRIQNRTGRLHLQGIGWTKEEDTDSTADALGHWDLIYGKPSTFAPSTHSHSNATTSAAGFMSSTDKTKLDGIETSADVTDATNVSAAGALMKSGGTMTGTLAGDGTNLISGFVAPQNPEGSHIKAPWFFNDLAYARLKGATVSVTVTGGSAASNSTIDAMFDASTGYGSFSTSGVTSVVIEISNMPKNFTYGTHLGVTFGNTTWRAKDVQLESYYGGQWNTVLDISNQSNEYVVKSYNSSSSSQTKLRWTFSNFNAGTMRIVSLFCYNYNATGMPSLFMPLNGGTMYGGLTMNTGNINLSGNKIYADTSSPTAHIQVGAGTSNTGNRSNVALLGEANSGGIVNALGLVNTAAAANSNGVALNFHNANNYSPTGQIVLQQNSSGTTTHSAMKFFTYGTNNLTHQMSIKSDGTIRFLSYGAGLIKSDSSGNLSVDTSTYLTGIAANSVGIGELNVSDGSAGQALTTDGDGNLAFATISGGSTYTLPAATSSALGGVKIGYTANAKNYPVQLDASSKAYVNVPWTDANTTYSAGTGLDLSNGAFSVEADLRDGITHIGKDANNYITFDSTNGRIDFYAGGHFVARIESDVDLHIKGDVIAFSNIFA